MSKRARTPRKSKGADDFRKFTAHFARFPVIDYGLDWIELWRAYQNGSANALERLVGGFIRFVFPIAYSYRRYGVPVEDLVQEGAFGILKALKKFEPERGNMFSTYAGGWVKSYIRKATREQTDKYPYTLPPWMIYRRRYASEAAADFRERTGCEPTPQEILDGIKAIFRTNLAQQTTLEEVLDCQALALPLRFQSKMGEDGQTLEEMVGIDAEQHRNLERDEFSARLPSLLEKLPLREQQIIRMRFGLGRKNGSREYTLREIGERWGISRERVRQLENKALRSLRFHCWQMRIESI